MCCSVLHVFGIRLCVVLLVSRPSDPAGIASSADVVFTHVAPASPMLLMRYCCKIVRCCCRLHCFSNDSVTASARFSAAAAASIPARMITTPACVSRCYLHYVSTGDGYSLVTEGAQHLILYGPPFLETTSRS